MIIVIDGYNLLKQIFTSAKNNLDNHKNMFIQKLAYYKKDKQDDVKEIVLVFDAGPGTHATRIVKSGIVIVYSGIKSSADDWIMDFVQRKKGSSIVVVSNDRTLKESCIRSGADVMDVHEFYGFVQNRLVQGIQSSQNYNPSYDDTIEKYEDVWNDDGDDHGNHATVDILMEQAVLENFGKKTENEQGHSQRKPNAQKLSKKDRNAYSKMKKLR